MRSQKVIPDNSLIGNRLGGLGNVLLDVLTQWWVIVLNSKEQELHHDGGYVWSSLN
jgi:hypothetical protein